MKNFIHFFKVNSEYYDLLSLTSLHAQEFFAVLQEFEEVWRHYYQRYDLKGKKRKLPKFLDHADISLKGSYKKLLFILIYMKKNPTQELLGAKFNMSQGKVSQWVKLLFPLFEQTLAKM